MQAIGFLQTLLDASLLTLVQHEPAHPVLARLAAHVGPELALQVEMERLRGPLEPFLRVACQPESDERRWKRGKDQAWRRRQQEANRTANIAVGVYQVERLVI